MCVESRRHSRLGLLLLLQQVPKILQRFFSVVVVVVAFRVPSRSCAREEMMTVGAWFFLPRALFWLPSDDRIGGFGLPISHRRGVAPGVGDPNVYVVGSMCCHLFLARKGSPQVPLFPRFAGPRSAEDPLLFRNTRW